MTVSASFSGLTSTLGLVAITSAGLTTGGFDPTPSPSPAPANAYVAEDNTTYYVAQDGATYYVQES